MWPEDGGKREREMILYQAFDIELCFFDIQRRLVPDLKRFARKSYLQKLPLPHS